MTTLTRSFPPLPSARLLGVSALALGAAGLLAVAVTAQVEGDRGITAVAASNDLEVRGIEVNVTGDNAEDARQNGWREAQRLAWKELGGGEISDSDLESLVSAVVIEQELVGPRRYVATLGVIFDRQRVGGRVSSDGGPIRRSAPMLTLPVLYQGGSYTMFETRNEWQRAWAEYNISRSRIDYVRPSGANAESLLLTYGQTGRRSRVWWRNILDQFGAADVLIPIARIERQWPGGPVQGQFVARYGPDNTFLDSFTLTAKNDAAIPAMYEEALTRFDRIFTSALASGRIQNDPSLGSQTVTLSPEWRAFLDQARAANAAREAAASRPAPAPSSTPTPTATPEPTGDAETRSFVIQFPTNDGAALDQAIASVRGTPGVRGAAVSSTAIGGMSVMRVTYDGEPGGLASALRARGWTVTQGGNTMTISR